MEALELVLRQLGRKLGAPSECDEARIRSLSLTRLEELGLALLDFGSYDDLEAFLRRG